jgi:hypothetical protein
MTRFAEQDRIQQAMRASTPGTHYHFMALWTVLAAHTTLSFAVDNEVMRAPTPFELDIGANAILLMQINGCAWPGTYDDAQAAIEDPAQTSVYWRVAGKDGPAAFDEFGHLPGWGTLVALLSDFL